MALGTVLVFPDRTEPEVVLHVSSTQGLLWVSVLELVKDLNRTFPEDIRHDVQAPPVGHPDNDVLCSISGQAFQRHVHEGD